MADTKKDKDKSNTNESVIKAEDKQVETVNQPVPTQSFVSSETPKSKPNLTIYAVAVLLIVIIFVVVLIAGGHHKSATHSVSTDTWTGKGKTNKWSDSANWTNGVPKKDYDLTFNTASKSTHSTDIVSDNDLGDITFNSIKFTSGTTVLYQPFEITGDAVNVGSGGLILDSTNGIVIDKLNINDPASINGQTKTPAIFSTSLGLNSNALGISDTSLTLDALAGSGNITVNKEGFLSFNEKDTKNPSYSGNISVMSTGQITLDPSNKDLGMGSLAIANGGKLFFKLNSDAVFSNAIVLGGTGAVNAKPYVDATSDIVSDDGSSGLILTFTGNITLDNNATLSTSAPGNNLAPVQYVITHKISGKYKLEPGTSSVNISEQ